MQNIQKYDEITVNGDFFMSLLKIKSLNTCPMFQSHHNFELKMVINRSLNKEKKNIVGMYEIAWEM